MTDELSSSPPCSLRGALGVLESVFVLTRCAMEDSKASEEAHCNTGNVKNGNAC